MEEQITHEKLISQELKAWLTESDQEKDSLEKDLSSLWLAFTKIAKTS